MLGPVFGRDGAAFAHVGLEAFAAGYGVRVGDNLVVDPSRASDVEGPSVWAAGPDELPAAPAHDALRRAADLLAAHARGRAARDAACPASRSPRWSRPAPKDGARPTCRRSAARRTWRSTRRAIARARSASRSPSSAGGATSDAAGVPRHRAAGHELRLGGLMLRDYDADFVASAIAWLSDREARAGVGPEADRPHRARPDRSATSSWAFRLFVIALAAADRHRRRGDVVAAPAMKTRGLVGLAVVAAALGAVLLIDARRGPSGGGERARGARAPAAAVRPKDRPADHDPPAGRRAVLAGARAVAERARARARLARRAPRRRRRPTTPRSRICWPRSDLAESDRIADVSADAAGLQPARGRSRHRDGRRRALGAAGTAGRGGAGRLRARRRARADPRGRPPLARARGSRAGGVPRPPSVPGGPDGGDVDRLARRGRRAASCAPSTGAGRTGARNGSTNGRVVESLRRLLALRIDRFDVPTPAARGHRANADDDRPARRGSRSSWRPATRPARSRAAASTCSVPADALEAATRAAERRRGARHAPGRDGARHGHAHRSLRRPRARRLAARRTAPGRSRRRRSPYTADTRVVDEWLARLGAIRTATRADGRPRASPDPRGPLSRRRSTCRRRPTSTRCSRPIRSASASARVLSFARFDVRRLQRQAGKTHRSSSPPTTATVWRAPSGGDVDAANAARVVGALSDLRAEEFVAAPPAGEPQTRLEIDVQPPGETHAARHVVQLWPLNDGGCVARLPDAATRRSNRSARRATRSGWTC